MPVSEKAREIINRVREQQNIVEASYKTVVRDGKKQRKLVCPSGYKAKNGKCVKMTADELRKRSRSQKKASRKRKSKQTQTNKKRQRSLKKR